MMVLKLMLTLFLAYEFCGELFRSRQNTAKLIYRAVILTLWLLVM